MLSAIISYLGPFSPDVRVELLNKWRELCHTGNIDINPKDARLSLIGQCDTAPCKPSNGFPIPLSKRLQMPLRQTLAITQESPSARAIVKVLLWGFGNTWAQHWPLLADTQQHLDIRSQSYLTTGEGASYIDIYCHLISYQLLEEYCFVNHYQNARNNVDFLLKQNSFHNRMVSLQV